MALLHDALSHRSEVIFVTDEGEGDEIDTLFEPDLEIGPVFLRKGCHPKVCLGKVDTLSGGHSTSDDDRAEQPIVRDLADLELGETVGEEDALADSNVLEEVWIADRENTVFGLSVDTECNDGPRLEMDPFFRELSEANLGASEILEDADLATE
jgi:alkylation response protein AidB-like acyl-CoA dehydrogenase